jgi:GH15 family glucan-1,4-alpha-glucosidase
VSENQKSRRKKILRSEDGFLALEHYGALGDGRSVAVSGADGSIDWWCVPNMDSAPLFDRLLDPENGGFFLIEPAEEYVVERRYLPDSNVLETVFTVNGGRARLTESLNSGTAGRLPWAELARRVEGLEGEVVFRVKVRFSRRADTVNPYFTEIGDQDVFHADRVLGLFLRCKSLKIEEKCDLGLEASFRVKAGERKVMAIVAGEDEPLVVPKLEEIDRRLDISDQEWRDWVNVISYEGKYRDLLIRNALALKFLLFSPSGAISAAATTSLPERIGGNKNYDYRFAWVRDMGYTIKAFLRFGAQAEAKAAFSWLIKRLAEHGARVCYTLGGARVADAETVDIPGYGRSRPVVKGNIATNQHQHGIYGDLFETAARFVACGNILDGYTAETLSRLADRCADQWRRKDSGIWELPEERHYTMSKISCWQALARAVELSDGGHLPTTCRERWARERDRVEAWINENCWSEEKQAYVFYQGSERLDASLALAVRFRFDGQARLRSTLDAIDRELGRGPYHYRYTDVEKEEGCFLACSFWMVEARALLGQKEEATRAFEALIAALDRGVGIYSEMVDPRTGAYLGNLPQGLTHLAVIQAAATLDGQKL